MSNSELDSSPEMRGKYIFILIPFAPYVDPPYETGYLEFGNISTCINTIICYYFNGLCL